MRMLFLVGCGLLCASLFAAPLSGQAIRGQITDAGSDVPLAGVTLTLVGPENAVILTTRSDSVGRYRFTVEREGTFRVRAEHVGFRPATSSPIRLDAGRVFTLDMRLPQQIVQLDTVRTPARATRRQATMLRDYYRRLEQGAFGAFITYDDIQRWRPQRISEMLASQIPGVQLSSGRGDGFNLVVRGTCSPTIYIDGIRVFLMGQNIDELVRPMEIEGVEVYRSISEAPPMYQGMNAGCSAILVWTRIGRR